MRGGYLVALLFCAALAFVAVAPARAEDPAAPSLEPSLPAPAPEATPAQSVAPAPATPEPSTAPVEAKPAPVETAEMAADPVVVLIRTKLADPSLRKGAHADDLAALAGFYATRAGGPVWTTEMGLTAKGQAALFEIEKAKDWGLDTSG